MSFHACRCRIIGRRAITTPSVPCDIPMFLRVPRTSTASSRSISNAMAVNRELDQPNSRGLEMLEKEVTERAFAMPLTSPAYPPGPYRFVNREYLIITYRTDP